MTHTEHIFYVSLEGKICEHAWYEGILHAPPRLKPLRNNDKQDVGVPTDIITASKSCGVCKGLLFLII